MALRRYRDVRAAVERGAKQADLPETQATKTYLLVQRALVHEEFDAR
jgi:hypothetical protein